ncbi:hypothetical protein [Telmatospirillum siberiense]|uniref:Uncharacterized protein n=1 Tax=Telmatospirillum siberiense TaxID=382514 RepID=A0A2N3PYT9_9PROT|nr:hypothetical protein [Telmatospirillum siberiense]PKU25582.1 hypothetical protein CWS72_05840 [Telmatospirillum siberiense]
MIMRRWLHARIVTTGTAVVLCAQLGACALLHDEPSEPAAPPPPPKPTAEAPTVKPAPSPAKPEKRTASPTTRQAKAPPASPEELIGLDETGVRKFLGSPAETRTDGAARILSYRSVGCTLEVIFFLDLKAGDLRVLNYQWDGNRTQAAKGCYSELRVAQ